MNQENEDRTPSRGIRHLVGKAVHLFSMIKEGDRILIGLSGGKDSLLLSLCLKELQRRSPVRFELYSCFIDPTNGEWDISPLRDFSQLAGIQLTVVNHATFSIIDARAESNPCSLCANLRRGILASQALKMGCNVVALGHHLDDAMETALMNLLMAGRFKAFDPVMTMSRTGIRVIRPMVLVREKSIAAEMRRLGITPMAPTCPFGERGTKRSEVKELIAQLESQTPGFGGNMLNALLSIPSPFGWGEPQRT
ncbi:MAG: hypothetical protein N2315_01210 [Thermanaerothrix sp.]|nr:hypothetical protein [Thermanaerothrix sp.]